MLTKVKIRKILEMGANPEIALALESKTGQDNDSMFVMAVVPCGRKIVRCPMSASWQTPNE